MIGRDELARSLTGAWELFLDRPGAMRHFDVSVEGFWRSFRAVVLVVPAYLVAALADREFAAAELGIPLPPDGPFLAESAIGLALDWIALPLILAVAARPLGIARRYAAFIVARNWCAVLAVVPFGAIGLLVIAGLVGPELGSTLMLAALIVVLRYNYLVARRGLEVGAGFAIGIVALDFAVSLTIAVALDEAFAA
jgi:hypothetical protein